MNKHLQTALAVLSAVGGVIIHYLGGLDHLIWGLIALMCIDYITGVAKAFTLKKLDSAIGFRGIVKKALILCVVATAYVVGRLMGEAVPLREMVILFFAANEGLSILENAASAGLGIPKGLKDALAQLRGEKNG